MGCDADTCQFNRGEVEFSVGNLRLCAYRVEMAESNERTFFALKPETYVTWTIGGFKGRGRRHGRALPLGPISYHFHTVFGKKLPNNRLTPPPWELASRPPPPPAREILAPPLPTPKQGYQWIGIKDWLQKEDKLILAFPLFPSVDDPFFSRQQHISARNEILPPH